MAKLCKLIALACVLLCLEVVWMRAMAANVSPERPLRSVGITIPESSQNELVEGLERFADTNAFAMRVGKTTPDGRHILVQMWREDLKVIGVNAIEPGGFRISFYKNNEAEPAELASIDGLIANLKRTIVDVRGLTFSEQE